jgi:hypothetical protein
MNIPNVRQSACAEDRLLPSARSIAGAEWESDR